MPATRADIAACALIATVTLVIYWPVHAHLFVYDTLGFVWENPYLREPSGENLWWALTGSYRVNWQPLTWYSHMLDFALFGEWPGGHHLTNVACHLAASLLLYFLFLRLLTARRLPRPALTAAVAALLFAIHPLHVESVAMVFERRDTLSAMLLAASAIGYTRWAGSGRRGSLALCWIAYLLALATKPTAVTFPLVLLLIDYWLRRDDKTSLVQLVGEKLLMLMPAIIVSLITVTNQDPAMVPLDHYPLAHRIANVFHNVWFFSGKFVLPTGLSPFYPFPPLPTMLQGGYWLPGVMVTLAVLAVAVMRWRRGARGLLLLGLAFALMYAPVAGLIHLGTAVRTDHYVYLALAAIAPGVAHVITLGVERAGVVRTAAVAGTVLWIGFLAALASTQVSHWRSPLSLWHYTLDLYPDAILPRRNLALTYAMIGEDEIAREHIDKLPPGEREDALAAWAAYRAAGAPGAGGRVRP